MKLQDIHIRDPFILLEGDTYYLYGSRGMEAWGKCTGLDVYTSADLTEWSGPTQVFTRPEDFWSDMHFWAPEVHKYKDNFYMFVSFKSEDRCRGAQILSSPSPLGPFVVHSDGPVTPAEWECLDGTLYIDGDNVPYMVFCHEWVQVRDGEMCVLRLSDDLRNAVGEPSLLFRASEPSWAIKDAKQYVTDGPFLHRTGDGQLFMLWSSFTSNGYCSAIAYSQDGTLSGGWRHNPQPLIDADGGHGMFFCTKEGDLKLVLHQPNSSPNERPRIIDVIETAGSLQINQ